MYVRREWRPSEASVIELIETHPWALLVSGSEGAPVATNLPLLLDHAQPGGWRLTGHLARANAHAAALQAQPEPVLAIFQGPYSYVTSSWYPGRDMPPTYYYTAVHCRGRLVFQDAAALREALEELVDRMEAPYPQPWATAEIPEQAITRRLPRILGFRIEVQQIEAKFKLGQDEPRRDALAVAEHLLASPRENDRALGALVEEYNRGRKD
ncbi:MAG: FMN-binding negative transcriptional regulator [Acidobacteria bacterium]|nr:MAG: FMN-binding negative transcriptional regulator [Acidobacteriota bacterium]